MRRPPIKLIIQIPCLNEEQTLAQVIHDLPAHLPGITTIEVLVINDGSTDRTVQVARENNVHHVVHLKRNTGCGAAFQAGLARCIDLGADIIVNTDGDNQYQGDSVADLVRPILEGAADMVIGTRPIEEIDEFSWSKKKLQRIGSAVAGYFSGTTVPDATSGFRAFSAQAAMKLHLVSAYSHTLETIIQAGNLGLQIASVPIRVNPKTRDSRLIVSTGAYIRQSARIILRAYIRYRPMRTFLYLALIPFTVGMIICFRFLYYFFFTPYSGFVQSLILAAILLIIAGLLLALGIIADLIGANRDLNQEILYLERHRQWLDTRFSPPPTVENNTSQDTNE